MTNYTYELIPGGFVITGDNGFELTQSGDPTKPAVDGVLIPYTDDERDAAAKAAISFYKAAEATAGSMRAPGF